AIAGLLNNTMTSSLQKIPGIGDIPILGLLFKSKAAQKNQTELVVMITPTILQRNSSGVTPNLPRQVEPYLPQLPPKKTFDPPPAAFPQPGRSQPEAAVPPGAPQQQSATTPSPADAARTLSALTPSAPKKMESAPEAAPAVSAPESAVTRPLTPAEQRTLERARREERERAREGFQRQSSAGQARTRAGQARCRSGAAPGRDRQEASEGDRRSAGEAEGR
ncbi:MAG: hypothetical protein DMF91_24930, partial [Acidobacteria bacterium]